MVREFGYGEGFGQFVLGPNVLQVHGCGLSIEKIKSIFAWGA